jgi:ArsR family transcriptional regulator
MPGAAASPTRIIDLDALFRGFADPTRIRLMNVLAAGQRCVCDLLALRRRSQPTVSRHMAYLRRASFVEARPELRFIYHKLRQAALAHCTETDGKATNPLRG